MVQIYKKILIGKGIEEKIKRKTATNHHNKQAPPPPPPPPLPLPQREGSSMRDTPIN